MDQCLVAHRVRGGPPACVPAGEMAEGPVVAVRRRDVFSAVVPPFRPAVVHRAGGARADTPDLAAARQPGPGGAHRTLAGQHGRRRRAGAPVRPPRGEDRRPGDPLGPAWRSSIAGRFPPWSATDSCKTSPAAAEALGRSGGATSTTRPITSAEQSPRMAGPRPAPRTSALSTRRRTSCVRPAAAPIPEPYRSGSTPDSGGKSTLSATPSQQTPWLRTARPPAAEGAAPGGVPDDGRKAAVDTIAPDPAAPVQYR